MRGEGGLNAPFLDQLVGATDEFKLVQVVEFVDNFGAKKPSCASRADLPRVDVFWVGPNQIAKGALGSGEN